MSKIATDLDDMTPDDLLRVRALAARVALDDLHAAVRLRLSTPPQAGAAAFDWGPFLQILAQALPYIIQMILALIGPKPPGPSPAPTPAPTPVPPPAPPAPPYIPTV